MPSTSTDRISGLSTSVAIKAPVACATTANITLSGEQTIDGIAVTATGNGGLPDRVLVKDQANAVDNGIWEVSTGAWSRARDFDGARDITQGTLVFVYAGDENGRRAWHVTTDAEVVVGTSEINFELWPEIATEAELISYTDPVAPAYLKTVSDIINGEEVSLFRFIDSTKHSAIQARTNTDDLTANFNDAINSQAQGLYIPRGTFKATGVAVNKSNLRFRGDGIDSTIIQTDSATGDVFTQTGDRYFLQWSDMTVGSSVVKSAGSLFNFAMIRRSLLWRVKLQDWFNGINFATAEVVSLGYVQIARPSGAGTAIIIGTAGAAGQVSGLNLNTCFIRGNDDVTQNAPTALYGLDVYDVDALTDYNSDIGGFVQNDMRITPTTRAANFFFTQTQFDATKSGDCILLQGAGVKQQFSFSNAWVSSAGKLTGGNVEAVGINFSDNGAYSDINYVGGRVYNNSGSGVKMSKGGGLIGFKGTNFLSNGKSAATNKYNFFCNPTAANSLGLTLDGCGFSDGGTKDVYFGANSRDYEMSGGNTDSGVTNLGANYKIEGVYDKSSNAIASATTIAVNSTQRFFTVSGTTNIAGITATFADHVIQLKFSGVLTVLNASQNIQLASNFTTAAGSVLTLMCDGASWYEIGRKA